MYKVYKIEAGKEILLALFPNGYEAGRYIANAAFTHKLVYMTYEKDDLPKD